MSEEDIMFWLVQPQSAVQGHLLPSKLGTQSFYPFAPSEAKNHGGKTLSSG